jgi:hypothetical protein
MRKHFKFIENITYETGDVFFFKLEKHFFYNLFRLFFLSLRGKAQELDLNFFLKNGLNGNREDVDTFKKYLDNHPHDMYLTKINQTKGENKIHILFSTSKGFCYCTVNCILYEIA